MAPSDSLPADHGGRVRFTLWGRMVYKLGRNARTIGWAFRNRSSGARIHRELRDGGGALSDLARYERRFSSQNGEDGILEALFAVLGEGGKTFVEFGAGRRCCALRLVTARGWTGLWMDPGGPWPGAPLPVHREFVTAENVEGLFERHRMPKELDLLCIDIDGNDWWVWRAIASRRPRVVAIEYNASHGPDESVVIPYDPGFAWSGTDFYGASLLALSRLASAKGYALVGCDRSGTNAFFVAREHLSDRLVAASVDSVWRPRVLSSGRRWPPDARPRLTVEADGSVPGG